MRHGKKFNHLGRKKGHRDAMLSNMASSLILHKRIFTTTAKAKALRVYVEPLITRSKDNTTHSRRVVFSYLQDKDAVNELYTTVGPKVADRPGGYTRILKTHNRLGDNADMCMMELVDFNELMLEAQEKSTAKSGSKRTRRGGKKSTGTSTPKAAAEKVAKKAEEVAEEVKDTAEEVVETAAEKVEEVAENVAETTEDVVEEVKNTAEEAVEAVEDAVEDATDSNDDSSDDSSEEDSDEKKDK
ncbi:50S ribosomal protein L17 [bacterium]|nr:50S ribosomal protein L17 [bacterium]